ncbi:MAG TPA: GNAT family N-acetyltransferase [Steroidobacteraceae bacterium]|nr:GNAT family N-acetyltransferase [Steroidobacteraceae bacterium]
MKIRLAESVEDLQRISKVLRQLRPAFDTPALIAQIQEQQRQHGYRVAFVENGTEVLCVAGFVTGLKLAWGRYMYVDDLVTADTHRSRGTGAAMIAWLKAYARGIGCHQLHLDSGVQRFGAHRFYLRERFEISSHHFAMRDMQTD